MPSKTANTRDLNELSDEELKQLVVAFVDQVGVVFDSDGNLDYSKCWPAENRKQYRMRGKTVYYGRILALGFQIYAHRLSYRIFVGELPVEADGSPFHIHHACPRHYCANFTHLRSLTNEEHQEKHDFTENLPDSDLSSHDVTEIRLLDMEGLTHTEIAEEYPVGRRQISRICKWESWSDFIFPIHHPNSPYRN